MGVLRRAALTGAILAAAVTAGTAAAADDPAASMATGPAQAVILLSTPELPSGRSQRARERWHELRARSREILDRTASANDLSVDSAVPEVGLLAVDLGPGGLPALRRELAADPRVLSVHPDSPVQLRYSPNDPAFVNADPHAPTGDLAQWNLVREGGPAAWDLSKGNGAEVAVVDTGVDGSHPDLAGRIAGAQAFGTSSPTSDTDGHGTHTAGLACGQSDNSFGIASLGFQCSLFIAKIAIPGECSSVSAAIVAAANRNSDVISMSIGECDGSIVPALDYAQARGAVMVVSATNTTAGDGTYPEEWAQPLGTGPDPSFDRGLVVTSAQYDGTRSLFGSQGGAEATSRVSVAAYGSATNAIGGQQGILSTWPANNTSSDATYHSRTSINGDGRFAYLEGTSMAAPQVAGEAALIRAIKPDMPNTQVVHLIKATTSACGAYGDLGWGIVRADSAVAAALGRDTDAPTSAVTRAKRIGEDRRGPVFKIRTSSADASRCAALPVSGVTKVTVFARSKKPSYRKIGVARKNVLIFHGKRHRHYRFYSVAADKQGNREAAPAAPDLRR
jgi:serine protease